MNLYIVASAVFLLLWGILWKKSDWPNTVIKILFFAFGIWGLILSLQAFGFLIKIR